MFDITRRFTLKGITNCDFEDPFYSGLRSRLLCSPLLAFSPQTHTLTMNQRYVRLALVSADGNGLTVSLPSNAAVLPPGPYLCTVLYQGVPSEAQWFTVRA